VYAKSANVFKLINDLIKILVLFKQKSSLLITFYLQITRIVMPIFIIDIEILSNHLFPLYCIKLLSLIDRK
jgi:hypothetical protein